MLQRIFLHSLFVLFLLLSVRNVQADTTVDEHAPVGVMGDHYHDTGEWMTSYRFMHMDMPKNYSGTKELSVADVHNGFMISPVDMTMDMHMVGIMYGLTDDITAMLMIPHVRKQMDHRLRNEVKFRTNTEGIGDIKLSGLFGLRKLVNIPIHFNFGVSFPSGSIDEKGTTPAGPNQPLPYPMQLGSGTYAILPGFTYFDKQGDWSWGFQEATTIQLGENKSDYQLGDQYEATTWVAYALREWMSTSFRIKASKWGNITGADSRLNPAQVPTADPDLRGGERVDLFIGANFLVTEGYWTGHRLAFEVGYPVYQDLDGPQLGTGIQGTVGWQKAF